MKEEPSFEETEFEITEKIKNILRETSSWTYFLSVVGFVGIGVLIVLGALFGFILRNIPVNPFENVDYSVNYFSMIYFAVALVYFFPILFLFRFSKKLKSALKTNDNANLTSAFKYLKSHYKYMAILVIVVASLYFTLFLFGGIGVLF